jgi:putative DNA primase/helicase
LTLQGPQGLGKTSWCRSLVPDPVLRDEVIKLDHHLDGGKDSQIGAITNWIVEIGELDSSFRKDVARLKGFLTNDRDKVRRPYDKTEAEYQRRTVFMASVNQRDFLVDPTGNSRWWTLPCVEIDYEHGLDMQQVFAQLATLLEKGEQWWLTPEEEEQLEYRNSLHRSFSVVVDRLEAELDLDPDSRAELEALTASEVLERVGFERPTNPQAKECAAFLREHFGQSKRIQGSQKWYVRFKSPGGWSPDRSWDD